MVCLNYLSIVNIVIGHRLYQDREQGVQSVLILVVQHQVHIDSWLRSLISVQIITELSLPHPS